MSEQKRIVLDDELPNQSPFQGINNKTVKRDGVQVVQIRLGSERYTVQIATTPDDLARVKSFDDDAFGNHQGLSTTELKHIAEAGRVLMLEADEKLVGECQILLSPIPDHPYLPDDEAYCYGTAVREESRGQGYAEVLYRAQEVIARENHKKAMTLTVRVENARSIRARLHNGFRIVGYTRAFYGPPETGGSRLIMRKSLVNSTLPFDLRDQADRVRTGATKIAMPENVDMHLAGRPIEVAVAVTSGDTIDSVAHVLVERILAAHYIGTGLIRGDEYSSGSSQPNLLIFQQSDSCPIVEHPEYPALVMSEHGRLREVIVAHPPDAAFLKPENAINQVAQANVGKVDPIAFKEEFEAFVETLRREGIRVIRTSALGTEGRTPIFTRDPAFVIGDTFVIGMLNSKRQESETIAMRRLADHLKNVILPSRDPAKTQMVRC